MTLLLRAVALQRSRPTQLVCTRALSDSWNWKSNDTKSNTILSNEGSPITTTTIDPNLQTQVLDKCAALHASIMPLNEKIRGPHAKNSDKGTALPFVFLVGNHSSGKSSFINYILGRQVQTAGVAPTDDCFTVILPGPQDTDQDGPALVGDPDLGFSGLRQFGPTLIHHSQLKIRNGISNSNFMMVDSPGMIDSPHDSNSAQDRGYDFAGVVKWFAERADVVLLFFDPDKPGTTGETLKILLHSLAGMDHKLLIVLNKADQFKKVRVMIETKRIRCRRLLTLTPLTQIHDFARAYGSLCWNLSKVIPRKDLPRIFTMCLPVQQENNPSATAETPPAGLADLHQTRNDVVQEVMKAPKRRIDNIVTHLHDSVHLLMMHANVMEDIRLRYRKRLWEHRAQEGTSLLTGGGLFGLALYTDLPLHFTGGVVAATVLGVGGLSWFNASKLKETEEMLCKPEELSAAFQRSYAREVSEADEYTASTWQRVRDPLRMTLQTVGLSGVPTVSAGELQRLRAIIEEDIPALRRTASPTHFGKSSNGEEETS